MAKITPQEVIQRLKPSPKRGRFMAPSQNQQSSLTFDKAVGEKELLYIINNEDTGESYLCPADDKLCPVIGIWDNQDNTEEFPPNMKEWLKCQEKDIELWQKLEEEITSGDGDQIESGDQTVITSRYNDGQGLLGLNQWHQSSPYNGRLNIKTNIDQSQNYYWKVGCPAMSVSQVAYYWGNKKGYKIGCSAVSNYSKKVNYWDESTNVWKSSKQIDVYINENGSLPKIDNFDFQNMSDSITNKSGSAYQAISELMLYAVFAVKTTPNTLCKKTNGDFYIKDYASSSASQPDIYKGLKNYFGFKNVQGFTQKKIEDVTEGEKWNWSNYNYEVVPWSPEDAVIIAQAYNQEHPNNPIDPEESIIEKIIQEIKYKCPVILSGWTSSYSGGHTWVCDGYRKVDDIDYGHFNWGWGNCYNGYYRLRDLSPGSGLDPETYNVVQKVYSQYIGRQYNAQRTAIIGIYPDGYIRTEEEEEHIALGDVNKDGTVDNDDIIDAVKYVHDGNYVKQGDIDGDGIFSEKDIEGVYDEVTNPNDLSTKINYVYKIKRLTNDIVNTLQDINTNLRRK